MAAVAPRRAVAPPPADDGINFGDLSFYSGGFSLPEGDYALLFNVKMHDGFGTNKKGPMRLGVMVDAHSLTDPSADVRQVFYSMGSGADKSYAPNPETGKGLVAIPGGPGGGANNSTNWAILLKSLYDAGLPQGTFRNDLTVLDGIHVHMVLVPEPEERKGFQQATGEAGTEPRVDRKIPVVSEIKDDGKPWEGTGGIPAAGAKPKAAAKPAAKAAPAAAAKPAAQPAAATDDDVQTAAIDSVAAVLGGSPAGVLKAILKTKTFNHAKETFGDDMAQAVVDTYFSTDANLATVLDQLEYKIQGLKVVPAA